MPSGKRSSKSSENGSSLNRHYPESRQHGSDTHVNHPSHSQRQQPLDPPVSQIPSVYTSTQFHRPSTAISGSTTNAVWGSPIEQHGTRPSGEISEGQRSQTPYDAYSVRNWVSDRESPWARTVTPVSVAEGSHPFAYNIQSTTTSSETAPNFQYNASQTTITGVDETTASTYNPESQENRSQILQNVHSRNSDASGDNNDDTSKHVFDHGTNRN